MNLFRRKKSVLSAIDSKDVSMDPFPHVKLDSFLEDAQARALAREFPPLSEFSDETNLPENKKIFLQRVALNENQKLSSEWKSFLGRVEDLKLHHEIDRIFSASIREWYPDFCTRFGPIKQMKMAFRYSDESRGADLKFDYKCAVHSPSPQYATLEREAHRKGNDKLAELHLFLRHPDDLEGDCDLLLLANKDDTPLKFGERNQVMDTQLEEVARIPYETNRGVLFLNTRDSITKLTPRRSHYPLQYFIIVFELNQPLVPL